MLRVVRDDDVCDLLVQVEQRRRRPPHGERTEFPFRRHRLIIGYVFQLNRSRILCQAFALSRDLLKEPGALSFYRADFLPSRSTMRARPSCCCGRPCACCRPLASFGGR